MNNVASTINTEHKQPLKEYIEFGENHSKQPRYLIPLLAINNFTVIDFLLTDSPGDLLPMWINFNPTWMSNYIHYEVWYEITYPFPNFNDATIEVLEWISNSYHTLLGALFLIHAFSVVNVLI